MQKFRKISLLLNVSRVRAIPLSAAVILSALCSPGWAEQEAVKTGAVVSAEPDTGYSSQETRVYALPELVVSAEPDTGYSSTHSGTALGIPIPLEDTPQSVLTIKRQVLEDQQATTLWDGLKNVSGVFSRGTNSAVSEDFVIRGFRLDPRRNYYHNGVPYYNRFAAEPGNLERVEVLKGPASILYGAIEPGGIINTITPQPSTISTRQLYLSAGSYGHMSPRFSASGPLDREGRVLYRLYGSQLTTESFRDFVEQDRWYVNPSVYWGWSQSTALELNFELLRDERTADAGIVAILDQPASVPIDRFYGDPLYNNGLDVGLGVIYTGERQGNLDNDFILDDYVRVDATVTYRLQTLRVDLSVKNLTDVGYYQNAWRRDRIMPGTPRNYLLSLGYSL